MRLQNVLKRSFVYKSSYTITSMTHAFSQYSCWITNGNGANWAFHGPVLAVLAVSNLHVGKLHFDYSNNMFGYSSSYSDTMIKIIVCSYCILLLYSAQVNIVIMIIVIGVIVRARRKKTHDTFLLW